MSIISNKKLIRSIFENFHFISSNVSLDGSIYIVDAENKLRDNRYALTAGHPSFKISLSGGNFVAIKAARYWVGQHLAQVAQQAVGQEQAAALFEMANKVSDLDLKFVCIDPRIVNNAVVMHSRGAAGFGLCRIKIIDRKLINDHW